MINDKVFLGFPLQLKDVCQVYPPTVNDVVGNNDFVIYQSILTMTQEDLADAYWKDERIKRIPTPFEYLLIVYYQDDELKEKIHDAFKLFVHEPVTIVPEIPMLLIGKSEDELNPDVDLENPRLLNEDNYFDFQNLIREVMGDKIIEKPKEEEILDPRIIRWKAKVKYHHFIYQ